MRAFILVHCHYQPTEIETRNMIDKLMTRDIEVPPSYGVQEIVAYLCDDREVHFDESL